MTRNQRHAHQIWDSQERYPQAAAHFRDFAKTGILQNAEFVRKLMASHQKVTLETRSTKKRQSTPGVCGPGKGKQTRPLPPCRPPTTVTGEAATRSEGVPDVGFYVRPWNPAANGAPSTQRIGCNCNACTIELTSSLRTSVRRASCSTTPVNRRPPGTPHHRTRHGRSGPQLERRNGNGLPTGK